jgi:hypothetical protein
MAQTKRRNKTAHLSAEQKADVADVYQRWLSDDTLNIDDALLLVKKEKGFSVARATFDKVGKDFGLPGKRDYQSGAAVNPESIRRIKTLRDRGDATPFERVQQRNVMLEMAIESLRKKLEAVLPTEDPLVMNLLIDIYRVQRQN